MVARLCDSGSGPTDIEDSMLLPSHGLAAMCSVVVVPGVLLTVHRHWHSPGCADTT